MQVPQSCFPEQLVHRVMLRYGEIPFSTSRFRRLVPGAHLSTRGAAFGVVASTTVTVTSASWSCLKGPMSFPALAAAPVTRSCSCSAVPRKRTSSTESSPPDRRSLASRKSAMASPSDSPTVDSPSTHTSWSPFFTPSYGAADPSSKPSTRTHRNCRSPPHSIPVDAGRVTWYSRSSSRLSVSASSSSAEECNGADRALCGLELGRRWTAIRRAAACPCENDDAEREKAPKISMKS
mmetsp:Transcript_31607/g.71053  ORF Transcript_31607/g.71053 Transcript_31607/m.71053 type:complete len:236 (-) Transcript_31607:51-758(-)